MSPHSPELENALWHYQERTWWLLQNGYQAEALLVERAATAEEHDLDPLVQAILDMRFSSERFDE